jgi:hypothetical protein
LPGPDPDYSVRRPHPPVRARCDRGALGFGPLIPALRQRTGAGYIPPPAQFFNALS